MDGLGRLALGEMLPDGKQLRRIGKTFQNANTPFLLGSGNLLSGSPQHFFHEDVFRAELFDQELFEPLVFHL